MLPWRQFDYCNMFLYYETNVTALISGLLVASVGCGRMFQIIAGLALAMAAAFLVATRTRTSSA
jgi:hypothetical protein